MSQQVNASTVALLSGVARHCQDERCRTGLAADAELCDECGGTRLAELGAGVGALLADLEGRPVVFALDRSRPQMIGRASSVEPPPEIDLRPFAGSSSVHRRHAVLQCTADGWQVTHAGRNPLLVQRRGQALALQPTGSAPLVSRDWLIVGTVPLLFLA